MDPLQEIDALKPSVTVLALFIQNAMEQFGRLFGGPASSPNVLATGIARAYQEVHKQLRKAHELISTIRTKEQEFRDRMENAQRKLSVKEESLQEAIASHNQARLLLEEEKRSLECEKVYLPSFSQHVSMI